MSIQAKPRSTRTTKPTAPSLPLLAILISLAIPAPLSAQVPAVIHYQGRVLAAGTAFNGQGQFKFALVNADGSQTYWRNSADANSDGEPDDAVLATVTRGLYSVLLGDTSLPRMAALPNTHFSNSSVYLRVWFGDGAGPIERLTPDQRIAAVGYAMVAATVPDAAISLPKLAPDARAAIQNAVDQSVAFNAALQTRIDTLSSRVDALAIGGGATPPGLTASSSDPADPALLAQGFVPFNSTVPAPWIDGSAVGAPAARFGHSAVWAGDAWFIWGGDLGGDALSGGGSIYRPSLDAWEAIASAGGPGPRAHHAAVWTGLDMVVWGGFSSGEYVNTGGRYRPSSRQWASTSVVGAPAGRVGHVAVWTGARLLIWGGLNASGHLNNGALYDPSTDLWTPLSLPNPPAARRDAAFAWMDDRLILWGGAGANGPLNSGAQLVFSNPSLPLEWRAMASASAPSARAGHSLIRSGAKVIVWGGEADGLFRGDGAAFNPASDQWQPVSSVGAPTARSGHAAVWTGAEMLVLGGDSASGTLATGAAYNPATDRWRSITNGGPLQARRAATAVWDGAEALVFGGRVGAQPIGALQRLNPQPAWTFYRKP